MKRIVITGATGTIGGAVARALLTRGDQPVALSRHPGASSERLPAGIEWHAWADPLSTPPPAAALAGADGVIHLLGEPVSQRWTPEAKRRIRDSRVLSTRNLVAGLRDLGGEHRPSVLVSQSATGYYGPRGSEELDEQATAGDDFLADVVTAWEQEALAAAPDTRVVVTRTGVVLSPSGGALAKMLPFFRAGIGGPVAGGRQFVPWIHIDDVVAALLHCVDQTDATGAVNVAAPHPVDNAELSRALGRALRRPAVLPVPGLALRLLYGEMSVIVTTGQRAVPRRLEQLGFTFRHREIEAALRDVLS
ncbi:MAG TPA: TIGR01777 family oxidoreductase [Solirubrobacteraceae bacterium]|nr:TIGR01777 family oxidoreductase [Solirubrobacteraceae bacterium]